MSKNNLAAKKNNAQFSLLPVYRTPSTDPTRPMPEPRNQTVTFLTRRLREVGIRPDTKHGQNFLVDPNLQNLIIESAELGPKDVVLEVGTGTGSLTALMAPLAASVVSFEIDPKLFQLASEELFDDENVTIIRQDVLKNKNNFAPGVMQAVRERLDAVPGGGGQLKLVSNLPYNIATPVISNLLLTEVVPVSMTVTIQKELADRIVAAPRSKDYGALSIWLQSQCRTEIIRVMAPRVFWPAPKVTSAIIRLTLDETLRARIPDLRFFHQFSRSLFLHRRKFLRSGILSSFKGELGKPEVDAIMAEMQFNTDTRAEQLSVEIILALCITIQKKLAEIQK